MMMGLLPVVVHYEEKITSTINMLLQLLLNVLK